MKNLGNINLTMKQSFGTDLKKQSVPCFIKNVSFTGAGDVFRKTFVATQKEIADVFEKDVMSDGIAGSLPKNWLGKIKAKSGNCSDDNVRGVFQAFRAAVKHLKPYNAPLKSKEYSKHRADLENKRIKESSEYLTKALRHFGVLDDGNSIYFKRRKVQGSYIDRGYVLVERGKNPSLEKLFIKIFKKLNPELIEANFNGKYAETAHGLNLNELNCRYISKVYWGDMKGGFMATEYESPPKFSSPIVHFKKSYETLQDFAKDFFTQTGIEITELISRGIRPGKTNRQSRFEPYPKGDLIIGYLQSELEKVGLYHGDLHKDNAIIGTDEKGRAIVKIVDIGGVMKARR